MGRHAELFVPEAERRVWSPWLSITVEEAGGGGSRVRGRFSPHRQVWTLSMFLTIGLSLSLLVGASWGDARWAMDRAPWALLCLPVGIVLGGGLDLVSPVGQRLGAEQIERLAATLTGRVDVGWSDRT